MLYTGDNSIYTYTFGHKKKPDCPVCGDLPKDLSLSKETTLGEFLETLAERPEAQLKKPNIRTESTSLYYSTPDSLREHTEANLKKKISELMEEGEEMAVSDPALAGVNLRYLVRFS